MESLGKQSLIIGLLLLLLIPIGIASTASAQYTSIGIRAGDWFKYNGSINGTDVPLQTWQEMVTIESISGTNITMKATKLYPNGTSITSYGMEKVDTGQYYCNTTVWLAIYVIPADLDNKYVIPAFYPQTIGVNETIIRPYPDGSTRNTNHLLITGLNMTDSNGNLLGTYDYWEFYWDKATGVLVDWLVYGKTPTEYQSRLALAASNYTWAPELPAWSTVLLIPLFVTVAAAVIFKRKSMRIAS